MVFHNSKEQFYYKIEEFDLSDEMKKILEDEKEESGFYELCQKYSDIALNAKKFKDEKTGKVQGLFLNNDIDEAKFATADYVDNHNIQDLEGLLSSIKLMHRYAVENDDKRGKAATVYPEGQDRNMPQIGTYYDFCKLPSDIWESITAEVRKYISSGE